MILTQCGSMLATITYIFNNLTSWIIEHSTAAEVVYSLKLYMYMYR